MLASETSFLFEKSDNFELYEDSDSDILDINATWRLKFEDSNFCFLGPASGRNYDIGSPRDNNKLIDALKNGLSESLPMDSLPHRFFRVVF